MRRNSRRCPLCAIATIAPGKRNGCRFDGETTSPSPYVTPRTCAIRHVGSSLRPSSRRLRSNVGRVVVRYTNGSSGRAVCGSHATIPNPARFRNVFIMRGLWDWRTSALSVSNSTCPSETGSPRYASMRHIERSYRGSVGVESAKEETDVKQFTCGELVPGCEWRIEGETEREILERVAVHAREAHGMDEVPPEVADTVRASIVER